MPPPHGGAGGEPTGSLLEGIAASLYEQYQASEWLVPPGQPNDWRFMLAVCRAVSAAGLGWKAGGRWPAEVAGDVHVLPASPPDLSQPNPTLPVGLPDGL